MNTPKEHLVSDQVTFARSAQASDAAEQYLRLAEALIFASAEPVTLRQLDQVLPDEADVHGVMAGLKARYAGRGVEVVEVAGAYQFRTALDLAPRLTRVVQVPRRLPRVAMETLAIIAYHQPTTRAEIEDIRGASLSQNTLDTLLEAGLIQPRGRKEVPGRPSLWGTTQAFLLQFGLRDVHDLPRREDLLVEPSLALLPPTDGRGNETEENATESETPDVMVTGDEDVDVSQDEARNTNSSWD